ncbi:Trm112 family protein [Candidatus Margulisiibacteriota bacterium]
MLNEYLVNFLACPTCKNKVEYKQDKNILVCRECQIDYSVADGIARLVEKNTNK